jgi:hypothetical protein
VHKLSGEFANVSKSAINDWHTVHEEILKKYALTDICNADKSAYTIIFNQTII